MMQQCSGCNMVGGSCSCGWLFSGVPSSHTPFDDPGYMYSSYGYSSSSSYSSVDCTLSLGTPSTRLSNESDQKRRSSCVSDLCSWKFLQSKSHESSSHKSSNRASSNNSSGDSLSARRCANCDTTSTPLWRNGPKGPKSLCNACGIRYKKEERRASAAAATSTDTGNAAGDAHHMLSSSWVQNQKMPYFSSAPYGNEIRFIDNDENGDSDAGIPFLPWRLNVTDRPGLVYDFTR